MPGAGLCFQAKPKNPSWAAPCLRFSPGHPEQGQLPSRVLSHFAGSRGCPVFSPDRCFFFFWERSPPPGSAGLGLRPPMSLFTMILEEGVENSAADGGSGAARVAERVAALGLSGVAAFCISKCALSAGALGRNCHLLPHCQPRRGYASFADSQPPALITRSTPSPEPPGQSRHIPSRCCTAGRRAGAGVSVQSRSLHPSLPAGIALSSPCPCLLQHPAARAPAVVLGCTRAVQVGHPCKPPSPQPSLPVGIAPSLRELLSWLPAALPHNAAGFGVLSGHPGGALGCPSHRGMLAPTHPPSVPGASRVRGPPSPAGTSRALKPVS